MIHATSPQCAEQRRANFFASGFLQPLSWITALLILSGCTVITAASREKGVDPSAIQPGVSRVEAETILGNPIRQWTSETGVRYRLYTYDDGHRPDPGLAAVFMFMNGITLGLHEVFAVITPAGKIVTRDANRRTFVPVVVSYNEEEIVLGIFDEFANLPADGVSAPRKWKP